MDARSGPRTSCLTCEPKQRPHRINLAAHHFGKICHLSWFYHCSRMLLVLPAIIAKPPRRSGECLASFIKVAQDRSVISWISADLSCSAPTSPRMPEEIISRTKSTTFSPGCYATHIAQKGHWNTLQVSSAHLGFTNLECDGNLLEDWMTEVYKSSLVTFLAGNSLLFH